MITRDARKFGKLMKANRTFCQWVMSVVAWNKDNDIRISTLHRADLHCTATIVVSNAFSRQHAAFATRYTRPALDSSMHNPN
jgi:hypothetical protein